MNSSPRQPAAPFLRTGKNGDVTITVHVIPNAAKTQADGLHGEAGDLALRVRLHAPPVEGKANQALIKWLAGQLGIAPSTIELVRGDTSRRKQLRVSARVAEKANWEKLDQPPVKPQP
ncbi:DUF167 domain-containing protein [Polaromonas sp.]|uniref:DUF167 domain-containing protein n=1 Tax=Polaromonas sp. TaxID=1869339 RepID=UPI002FCA0AE6